MEQLSYLQKYYKIGDSLNLNIQFSAWFSKTVDNGDGTSTAYSYMTLIPLSDRNVTLTGFSSDTEGTKTVTLSYGGKTTTFDVIVYKPDPVLTKIEYSKGIKKNYVLYEEDLEINEGELIATYSDGSTETISLDNSDVSILDFDNTKEGDQEIHITYNGMETSTTVKVSSASDEITDEEEDSTIDRGPIQKVEVVQDHGKIIYYTKRGYSAW
jgi:hypothetical protein